MNKTITSILFSVALASQAALASDFDSEYLDADEVAAEAREESASEEQGEAQAESQNVAQPKYQVETSYVSKSSAEPAAKSKPASQSSYQVENRYNSQALAPRQAYRNAFFLQGNVGFSVQNYSEDSYDESLDYVGFGPLFTFKLGISFKSLWALNASMGLAYHSGTLDYTDRDGDDDYSATPDNPFFRVDFGIGGTVYPFRESVGFANGIFFSIGFGMTVLEQSSDDTYYSDSFPHVDEAAFGLKFELGKTWHLGHGNWNAGIVFTYEYELFDLTETEDEYDYYYDHSYHYTHADPERSSWALGVAFVIMRR